MVENWFYVVPLRSTLDMLYISQVQMVINLEIFQCCYEGIIWFALLNLGIHTQVILTYT